MKVMSDEEMQIRRKSLRKTILPVLSWTQCCVCGRWFKYTRMWVKRIDKIHWLEIYYVCPECASDGYEAYLKLKV